MRKTVFVLLLTLLSTVAFADAHMEKKPSPILKEQLEYFNGNWTCRGVAYASPMAPEHPTEANVMMKWQGGGYWLAFTYSETKTTNNPMPFWVSGFFGYDPEQKKVVMGSVDNMGGYLSASSDGWKDGTLTFDGPWHMGTMTVKGRDSFTKVGDREIVHEAFIEQDGKWQKLGKETCAQTK